MADVVSFRFKHHELGHINKLSAAKRTDKTTAARELIEYGWTYYIIEQYKKGEFSGGGLLRSLGQLLCDQLRVRRLALAVKQDCTLHVAGLE